MNFSLEPIERDDPRVQPLYADFIREADGPLIYDRAEAGIDLDEEIAAGPPVDLTPPTASSSWPRSTANPPASAASAISTPTSPR